MTKPEITKRDLTKDYDESKFDRVGAPLGVENREAGDRVGPPPVSASSHTLVDMSADYEFFTTGVIHATTPFDRDPLIEFSCNYPNIAADALPQAIDYTESFFYGLGFTLAGAVPVNFDRRLYAVHRNTWIKLRDFVAGIAMMDKKSGFYGRINFYEIKIADPFALKKMSVVTEVPVVPVTIFGVSSNTGFHYLQPAPYPKLPYLVSEAAKPDMIIEGNAVVGPPPSPEYLMKESDEN